MASKYQRIAKVGKVIESINESGMIEVSLQMGFGSDPTSGLYSIEGLKKLVPANKNKTAIWGLTMDEVEKDVEAIKDDLKCIDYSIFFKPLIQVDFGTVVPSEIKRNKIKMISGHATQPNFSIKLFYTKPVTEQILQVVGDFLVKKYYLESKDCYWFVQEIDSKSFGIVFQIIVGETYSRIMKDMFSNDDFVEIDDRTYSFQYLGIKDPR